VKVGGTGPVTGVGPSGARSAEKSKRTKKVAAPASAADTVSIFGIPEDEMTPKVRAAIMQLMAEVDRMRAELERTQQKLVELEELADQDPLAPIANRRAFVRELTRMIAFSQRYGSGGSLIYLDLNEFKNVNDNYGHAAGDAALLHIAQILLANVRESDIVGRLGGDEFGVILVQASEDVAHEKAESLVRLIGESSFEWQGKPISLSAAFGVFAFQPGTDAGKTMAEADRLMYANKKGDRKKG